MVFMPSEGLNKSYNQPYFSHPSEIFQSYLPRPYFLTEARRLVSFGLDNIVASISNYFSLLLYNQLIGNPFIVVPCHSAVILACAMPI